MFTGLIEKIAKVEPHKLEDFYYSSVSKINKGIYSKDKLVSFLENNI